MRVCRGLLFSIGLVFPQALVCDAKGGGPPQISLTSDGKMVAATFNTKFRLYRVGEPFEVVRELSSGLSMVSPVAFRPDGTLLAVGGTKRATDQYEVVVYSSFEGDEPKSLLVTAARITDLCFSLDGRQLAIATKDRKVRIWDMAEGRFVAEVNHGAEGVDAVRFAPSGVVLATAGDHQVNLWDLATGNLIGSYSSEWGISMAFDPEGSRLLVGSQAERSAVTLWDLNNGKQVVSFNHTVAPSQVGQYSPTATSVAFGPKGNVFASSALDGTVRIWDASTLELLSQREYLPPVYAVAFTPSSDELVVYGGEYIELWELADIGTAVSANSWGKVKMIGKGTR